MNELTTLAEQFEIAQKSLVENATPIIIISGIILLISVIAMVINIISISNTGNSMLLSDITFLIAMSIGVTSTLTLVCVGCVDGLDNKPTTYSEFYIEYNKSTNVEQEQPHVKDKVIEYNEWYQGQLEERIRGTLSESEKDKLECLAPID